MDSNLESIEMKIKSVVPFSGNAGPMTVVSTCKHLATVSSDCARKCIDRHMTHGGQHPIGAWCPKAAETLEDLLHSHVWHVAPDGDDEQGIGSEERPMATISEAIGRGAPGDLIRLAGGVYAGGDDSCSWCTETPLWISKRCELFESVPDVKSAAECLLKCRDDATCEYAAYHTTFCYHSSERACSLVPVVGSSANTYYCPKNKTKKCNYNNFHTNSFTLKVRL